MPLLLFRKNTLQMNRYPSLKIVNCQGQLSVSGSKLSSMALPMHRHKTGLLPVQPLINHHK